MLVDRPQINEVQNCKKFVPPVLFGVLIVVILVMFDSLPKTLIALLEYFPGVLVVAEEERGPGEGPGEGGGDEREFSESFVHYYCLSITNNIYVLLRFIQKKTGKIPINIYKASIFL